MTLRLDPERGRALDREARRCGRTKSELLREAFDEWRRGHSSEEEPESLYDRISELIGIWSSGDGHLSEHTGRKFTELLLERKRARDADRRRTTGRSRRS